MCLAVKECAPKFPSEVLALPRRVGGRPWLCCCVALAVYSLVSTLEELPFLSGTLMRHELECADTGQLPCFAMSQLLLAATIVLLLLVGVVSADIMGFAFWKGNQFSVEGKVGNRSSISDKMLTGLADRHSHRLLPGDGPRDCTPPLRSRRIASSCCTNSIQLRVCSRVC